MLKYLRYKTNDKLYHVNHKIVESSINNESIASTNNNNNNA